jgi:hypothetical protein
VIAVLFWLFLASASAAVIIFGDRNSRVFLGILFAGVACTYVLNSTLGWVEAQIYIFVIDGMTLSIALWLVSKVDAYWPIWFSAFLTIAVATSLAQLVFPNHIPGIYINLQGFWFFPALISLVVGVMLDARAEQAKR